MTRAQQRALEAAVTVCGACRIPLCSFATPVLSVSSILRDSVQHRVLR